MSDNQPTQSKHKTRPALWKTIVLIILITVAIVSLFGLLIYLFTSGVQKIGSPLLLNLSIFVIISGIFAWLVKRLTDIILSMSHIWFSEDQDDELL